MSCLENIDLEERSFSKFWDLSANDKNYQAVLSNFFSGYNDEKACYEEIIFEELLKFDYELCLIDPMECLKQYKENKK